MKKNLMRLTFKQLFLAFGITLFFLASTQAYSEPNTELTPSEKDALAELGLTPEDLNVDLGRAPAELTPPTPAPAPKSNLDELQETVKDALSEEFFPDTEKTEAKKEESKKPAGEVVIPAKAGIQPTSDVKTSGEKSYDLTPPAAPKEDRVRYDTPGKKKSELANVYNADPLTRKYRMEKQEKANLPQVPNTGVGNNVFYPKPIEPKKEEPIPSSHGLTGGSPSLAEQHLVNQLKEYENIVKNKDLTQQQTQNLLDEYKKLLLLDKAKEALDSHPKEITSHPREGGDLALTRQQELALESLARMMNDKNIQQQKPDLIYNQIIPEIISPKLDETIKNRDSDTFRSALLTMVNVPEPKGKPPVITPTIHQKQTTITKERTITFDAVKELLDETYADYMSGDSQSTSKNIDTMLAFLDKDIRHLTIENKDVDKVWFARIINEELSDYDRLLSVNELAKRIEEGHLTLEQFGKRELAYISSFIESYKDKVQSPNEDTQKQVMEESGCPNIETLKKDITFIEATFGNMKNIAKLFQKESMRTIATEQLNGISNTFKQLYAEAMKRGDFDIAKKCTQAQIFCEQAKQKENEKITTTNLSNKSELKRKKY